MKTFLWRRQLYYCDALLHILDAFLRFQIDDCLCPGNHSFVLHWFICVSLLRSALESFLCPISYFPFSHFFAVTTLATPVSEITTLSSQSHSNATHPAASSSLSPDIGNATAREVLEVVPLKVNGTVSSSSDTDEAVTVTSSTHSPMTVNLSDAKSNPELGSIEQSVNNGSNNQGTQPQKESAAGDETEQKSRSSQEKEGRAFNFAGNNTKQSPVNYVTTSTEKSIVSFFDLSDVSMDHDEGISGHHAKENKLDVTTVKQTAEIVGNIVGCSHNGTAYKVSSQRMRFLESCEVESTRWSALMLTHAPVWGFLNFPNVDEVSTNCTDVSFDKLGCPIYIMISYSRK